MPTSFLLLRKKQLRRNAQTPLVLRQAVARIGWEIQSGRRCPCAASERPIPTEGRNQLPPGGTPLLDERDSDGHGYAGYEGMQPVFDIETCTNTCKSRKFDYHESWATCMHSRG